MGFGVGRRIRTGKASIEPFREALIVREIFQTEAPVGPVRLSQIENQIFRPSRVGKKTFRDNDIIHTRGVIRGVGIQWGIGLGTARGISPTARGVAPTARGRIGLGARRVGRSGSHDFARRSEITKKDKARVVSKVRMSSFRSGQQGP